MKIYHYEEVTGGGEYIILTEQDDDEFDVTANCVPGYRLSPRSPSEFDGDTGILPMDRPLYTQI